MGPLHRTALLATVAVAGAAAVFFVRPAQFRAGSSAGLPAGVRPAAESPEVEGQGEDHAWEMFEWWYGQRAYPNDLIPQQGFWNAWQTRSHMTVDEGTLRSATWTSIGPDNVGGRMLAVAVDPSNSSRVWAGAASGGLWLSTTGGVGAAAWNRVETGFPSVAVSGIAIDPTNPQKMVIGTGEIGRYQNGQVGTPGARSSYGLGILRSTDGGTTWLATGLTWTFDQRRAVQAVRMDPTAPANVWAATTEGVFRSTDGGDTWAQKSAVVMAMDVIVDPTNGQIAYASHGQLGVPDDTQAGIWKTTNAGTTWTRLAGGLPTTSFGRTALAISSDAARIWAGVSNASTRQIVGLYRSTNGGTNWTSVSSTNWASSQAWYDNVTAVSPTNSNLVICAGLDVYRSTTGGGSLAHVSDWSAGYEGDVPAGGPEGPANYVHADSHWCTFDPSNPATVYIACDGGIFKSTDSGATWTGANGGLRSSQFYAGFAFQANDHALGGLQDNGTLLYHGADSWNKTFGGDGGWCAIDPTTPNTLYEEYVYLNMYKSTDNGASWNEAHVYSSSTANFIAPFVLSPSSPNILYAGELAVEKSTDGGTSWNFGGGGSNWNGTPVATIGVSFGDANRVVAGTGSSTGTIEIRRTTSGGTTWTAATGYPARYPTDFAFDPSNNDVVWATFSGYGTGHVFRSTDVGLTWVNVSGNLPDLPHQTVAVDPLNPAWAYVGTDLGVYRTTDGGTSWTIYDVGMPPAMILDLAISSARRMRAATFGNGVWEIDLPTASTGVAVASSERRSALAFEASRPNPFRAQTSIRLALPKEADVSLTVLDAAGRRVRTLVNGRHAAGSLEVAWDGRDEGGRRVAAGTYFVRATGAGQIAATKVTVLQ
ncbi:MAG: FlgD immunoglobulin-like domain containing protein [bacterium]